MKYKFKIHWSGYIACFCNSIDIQWIFFCQERFPNESLWEWDNVVYVEIIHGIRIYDWKWKDPKHYKQDLAKTGQVCTLTDYLMSYLIKFSWRMDYKHVIVILWF